MLGSTVYSAVLDAIRKDKRGLAVSPDEFNRLSEIVNRKLLSDYCKEFESGVNVSSSIGKFKKLDQAISLTSGIGTLPTTYFRLIGEPWHTDATLGVRYFDIVTSLEHSKRERDYLTKSSTKYPTCVIGSEDSSGNIQIRVYPTSITTINIDYIRLSLTPFLDYYVNDTTLISTYLTEDESVTVSSGSTYRDGTTGAKNSTTVDWEWTSEDLPLIVAYFVEAIGGILPDEGLVQTGIKDKSEIK